jgi:hypothetical protein
VHGTDNAYAVFQYFPEGIVPILGQPSAAQRHPDDAVIRFLSGMLQEGANGFENRYVPEAAVDDFTCVFSAAYRVDDTDNPGLGVELLAHDKMS